MSAVYRVKLDLVRLRELAVAADAAIGREPAARQARAGFIGAVSPDVVLALLDEVERLRAAADDKDSGR
jgi:hypothetical protein